MRRKPETLLAATFVVMLAALALVRHTRAGDARPAPGYSCVEYLSCGEASGGCHTNASACTFCDGTAGSDLRFCVRVNTPSVCSAPGPIVSCGSLYAGECNPTTGRCINGVWAGPSCSVVTCRVPNHQSSGAP